MPHKKVTPKVQELDNDVAVEIIGPTRKLRLYKEGQVDQQCIVIKSFMEWQKDVIKAQGDVERFKHGKESIRPRV